jgi:hypothetical protein
MKFFLIISLFILTGCSNISDNNFDSKVIADKYLLTIKDFNDTFKVINNLDNVDSNNEISSNQNSENSNSRVNLIIDKAINELAECANNEVLFYSDKEAEYEGETLVGELFGGSDRVYAEINSFVYVKRGIEGEFEKFTKYKKCYGDYIIARFKASLAENIIVSDYSSEVVDSEKIKIIHYRFDVSGGDKIFPITNSLFINKDYSLISVAEVITIGGDATEDEYNNIIDKILN